MCRSSSRMNRGTTRVPSRNPRPRQVSDPAVYDDAGIHQDLAVAAFLGYPVGMDLILQGGKNGLHIPTANTAQQQADHPQGKADNYGNTPRHPAIDVVEGNRDQGRENQSDKGAESGGEKRGARNGIDVSDNAAPGAKEKIRSNQRSNGNADQGKNYAPRDNLLPVGGQTRYIRPQAPTKDAETTGPHDP